MSISQELIDLYTQGSDYDQDPKFRLAVLSHMFDSYVADLPELRMRIQLLIDAKEQEASNA